jgi:ribosome-binding protein aMBF1 (putative translation factor)
MEQDKKSCTCCGQVKTLDHFKLTRWGTRVNVCTECANQKARDNKLLKQQEKERFKALEDAKKSERQKMLEQYTPRELMNELARRGYTGELTYTMRIDITNF